VADGRDGYLAERRAEGLPGLAPGREGKREGLKVGTILSKIVPEVASFPTRNLSKPFEKIVPDFYARAGSPFMQTMRPYPSRQHPCRGLRIYIRPVARERGALEERSDGVGISRPAGLGIWRRQIRKGRKAEGG